MQGTASLLRSVTGAASQSPSKIPHLRHHIALRQTRSRHTKHNGSPTAVSSERKQSTLAPSEYAHRTTITSETVEHVPQRARTAVLTSRELGSESGSTFRHNFKETRKPNNMFDILERGLRDQILSGLLSDSMGVPFIRQADDQMFKSALLAVDPDYFVTPFKTLDRHSKGPRLANTLHTRTIDDRLAAFSDYLDRIVTLRRDSGWKLDLEMCNHLLKCAATMGDAHLARVVMGRIMLEDGVEPNLESYNSYAGTLVWSHSFSSVENYQLRVIRRHLEIRASKNPPLELSGHAVRNAKRRTAGIREEVLDVFKAVTTRNLSPDELTFMNLMIAMGREGDLDGVKSILKSVWNVDVSLLGAYDEEELESPTFYEQHHPLRPSENLLYTMAHIFGSNNDISTAWLLVDFFSRNYDIRVGEDTWLQLCEWAFILSLRRSNSGRKQDRHTGQVPQKTFLQLLDTMQDAPHNIRPSAAMFFMLSRSWRDKKHLDNTIQQVQKLEATVRENHVTVSAIGKKVMRYLEKAQRPEGAEASMNEEFYALRRSYMISFLEFQRNLQFMNAAVHRHLLTETNWPGSGKLTQWERRKLPDLVLEYGAFLPRVVKYRTQTGIVDLHTGEERLKQMYARFKMDYRVLPCIMNAMDTDDQNRLVRRMNVLRSVVASKKEHCFDCESDRHGHNRCPKRNGRHYTEEVEGTPGEDMESASVDDDIDMLVLDSKASKGSLTSTFENDEDEEEHFASDSPLR